MGNVIQWSYRVSTNYFQHPVYPYRMIVFVSVQFCSDRLNLYDGRRVGGVQAIIIHAMTVHCPLVSPRAPAELPHMIDPHPCSRTKPINTPIASRSIDQTIYRRVPIHFFYSLSQTFTMAQRNFPTVMRS